MKHQHRLNTARRALASSCGIDHVSALNFRASCLWLLVGGALWLMPSSSVGADRAEEFTRDILPVLKKKCFDCHGPESQKADLNLSVFPDFTSVTNNLEIWHAVLERVSAFEMPPKKATQLSFDEQGRLVRWLRDLPKSSPPDCSQLASDRTANFYKGYVMSRRLNREEYINTLRDLFGIRIPVEHLLPADGGGGEGFDTTGSALFLSSIHIEKYMAAAEEAVNLILPESTSKMPQELKLARDRILPRAPRNRADQPRAAREILARFS
ncbi:MAG: DUF1587 domain-containing protein, partial [Verrucomicrobia bacterium]|nr:DUF1587 domain-containing protein [Verrucomicrobiota bacterium]